MKLVPPVSLDDKAALRRYLQKLASLLGPEAVPVHAGLTLTGLTASSLIGTDASKLLESVTIGTGLDYTRPTLSLSHLGIEDLTDPGADRILFWDNSATASKWLAVGNSIAITTTTIDTIQDIRTSASPEFAGIELGHASDTTFTRVSAGVAAIEGNNIVMASEWLQNGFPNRTDSSISFNDGTRRFTINPSSSSFDYFVAGVKYTVSSSDVLNVNYVYLGATPAEGPWYIYYDGATLTAAVSPNHAVIHDIYENKAAVAIVFWDADNNKGQLLEDRHGLSMTPLTHVLIHETVGTRFNTGLALNSITADQNGNTNSHAQFGVDAGQIFDEDIEHTLNAIGSTTGLQIWHRDTSGWTFTTNAGYSVIKTGVGGEDRLAYDNSGTLTEVGDNDFVLCHVFATGMSHLNPIVAVGQATYATKKLAQQGALTEIVNILSIANISPELKPIASVIFQTKDTYSNAMKAKIVSTDEGDDYVDFRTDALNPAFSSAQSHGNLAGLTNDDHIQYLLADGTRALAGAWDMGSQVLTNVNIDSGVITGITDLAIGDGGTGQSTAQLAINALSAVSGATNEHVLTKDTGTGNAIFKAASGGTPGGNDSYVQYNNGGAFGGDSRLSWNDTANQGRLTIVSAPTAGTGYGLYVAESGETTSITPSSCTFIGTIAPTSQGLFVYTGASGAGSGGGMIMACDDGAAMADNDRLGYVLFGGSFVGGAGFSNSAGIVAYADGNWTSGSSHPARFSFETVAAGGTSRTAKLTIKNNGQVILGSVSSNATGHLLIKGATAGASNVVAVSTGASGAAGGTGFYACSDDGAALGSGHRIGWYIFCGSRSASNVQSASAITGYATENWVDGSAYGSDIRFETTAVGSTSRTAKMTIADGVFINVIKSGANQGAAGAAANELWRDTADNSIKIGV